MFKSNNKVPVQKWEQINLWWLPRGCRRTKAKSRTDCPHTKRDEILVAQLGDLPYLDLLRDEPRNEVPTPICTMKIFNVAVVVGGDHPPRELRTPLRSRRASIIYIDEIIMMTEVWQSCLAFWKCSTRPPKVKNKFYVSKKVKNKFYVSRTHYFKCLSTVST